MTFINIEKHTGQQASWNKLEVSSCYAFHPPVRVQFNILKPRFTKVLRSHGVFHVRMIVENKL